MDEFIPIDRRYVKIARSRWTVILQILSGVSISFAPLALQFYGQDQEMFGPSYIGIPVSWAIILAGGMFHIRLANHVISRIRRDRPVSLDRSASDTDA
ncbi:MAG: hypothetical protein R6U98_29560 [Pirellulaceae bacterium]